MRGLILINVGARRVFNFDTGDIVLSPVAADDDITGLADIQAGIGGADGRGVLDQNVGALHRIDAVGTILVTRTGGPFGAHAAYGDVFRAVDFQSVAFGVFNGQVFDGEVIGGDLEACRAGFLVFEGQNGLVHAFAAERDVLYRERKAAVELVAALRQLDHRPRLGEDQGFLQAFLKIRAGSETGAVVTANRYSDQRDHRDQRNGEQHMHQRTRVFHKEDGNRVQERITSGDGESKAGLSGTRRKFWSST